jgi:hypothetical protein
VEHLVGGHVREDQAHDLARVEVLGHRDRVLLLDADPLGIGPVHGQCSYPVSLTQPLAARAELLDDADELVAGREWRLRAAHVSAGADLSVCERHPGRQDPDANLTRVWSGGVLLHHLQDLRPPVAIDDDPLHDRTSLLRSRIAPQAE